ncbi:hypothetical protein N7532_011820 [Penicillium argentinense]|uniref:Peptidase A1 domain-containing protein n=1 Tax=Penicillium argentinense TaxID=1131581 RepID=A0A9W9EJ72_9EURO|nr:uncharacterized protein N7532_011820 [Penicillium argentinense]KAJ5082777.1 hypothetical protein N7532_011820 [Penicillium argentinense]
MRKYRFNPTKEGPYFIDVGEVGTMDFRNDVMYLAEVSVGTPAQTAQLDFDTGSADLWFASGTGDGLLGLAFSKINTVKPRPRDADKPDKRASFYTFEFIDQATVQTISRAGNKAIADTGTTLALVDDSTCQAIYDAIPSATYNR